MSAAIQCDWIEELRAPAYAPEDLEALETALRYNPEGSTGKRADIRAALLLHRAALLGQKHTGADMPSDVRFKETTKPHIFGNFGGIAPFHAWAISDKFMEMAGGYGTTAAEARADAMIGLMLNLNETSGVMN